MEKQEYILMAQKQRLAELEAELEAKTLKIQDVDAIVEEVSEAAYERACEVVTETVQAETVKADLEVISDFQDEQTAPGSKLSYPIRAVIGGILEDLKEKLVGATGRLLQRVSERLHEPSVKAANKKEISTVARESIMARLHMKQAGENGSPAGGTKKKKNRDQER